MINPRLSENEDPTLWLVLPSACSWGFLAVQTQPLHKERKAYIYSLFSKVTLQWKSSQLFTPARETPIPGKSSKNGNRVNTKFFQ